eukprot:9289281-Pyramimonas_sp.AAC.2
MSEASGEFRLASLLVVFALSSRASYGQVASTPSPLTDRLPGCAWSGFDCLNGGYFPSTFCGEQVPCEYCKIESCENEASWALNDQFACVCPEGFTGIDCSVAESKATCPEGEVLNQDILANSFEVNCEVSAQNTRR